MSDHDKEYIDTAEPDSRFQLTEADYYKYLYLLERINNATLKVASVREMLNRTTFDLHTVRDDFSKFVNMLKEKHEIAPERSISVTQEGFIVVSPPDLVPSKLEPPPTG